MTCGEIDELAGAIALDALPEEEWEAVRAHLATCESGHTEVRELVLLAARLVEVVPDVEPPVGMGERLMARLRADIARTDAIEDIATTISAVAGPPARVVAPPREAPPPASTVRPAPQSPKVVPLAARRAPWYARAAAGWGAAAAALLLAVGFAAWSFTLRGDLDDTRARLSENEAVLVALAGGGEIVPFAGSSSAEVALLRPAEGTPSLLVRGLERVPDRIYQLWMLRGSTPVSLGVFHPNEDGATVVPVTGDLSGVDALAITSEPSPNGSPLPTSQPVLVAPLRG